MANFMAEAVTIDTTAVSDLADGFKTALTNMTPIMVGVIGAAVVLFLIFVGVRLLKKTVNAGTGR